MTPMPTVKKIAAQIRSRVLHGDYLAGPLPGEKPLAAELGCSYLTARRAAELVIAEGLLIRNASGRLLPALIQNGVANGHRIAAFIADVYPSAGTQLWYRLLSRAFEARGIRLRMVPYQHWDAPLIREAILACDEIYILPDSETPPAAVMTLLEKHRERITILEYDWTDRGFHCIIPYPARDCLRLLMRHLKAQGYTRVDVVNVQPHDTVVAARIQAWDDERRRLGLHGELHDLPVASGGSPYEHASVHVPDLLSSRLRRGHAFVGITLPAAIGVLHALRRTRLKLGRDVGVCSVAGEALAKFLDPTITCVPSLAFNDILAMLPGVSTKRTARHLKLFHGMSTHRA